ncbi:MAG TPA: C4-type zinc ribbon domain-containing protein [Candidatus Binatia bacterium]
MSSQLEMLFQLQALDSRLQEKQRVIGRYEAELAARRAAIAACTARIDALAASRKDSVAQRAFAERKVEDLQEALKHKRQRAQKARNEKEVRAGQDEVTAALEEIRESETVLLDAMTRVEDLEKQIEMAKVERSELENQDHRQVSEAEARIEALRAELAAEREARDGAASGIEQALRKKYDSLLERRAGIAVVEVDMTGCCGGCHVQIPPQTLLEVRRTASVRVCPMCQRILFALVTETGAVADRGER